MRNISILLIMLTFLVFNGERANAEVSSFTYLGEGSIANSYKFSWLDDDADIHSWNIYVNGKYFSTVSTKNPSVYLSPSNYSPPISVFIRGLKSDGKETNQSNTVEVGGTQTPSPTPTPTPTPSSTPPPSGLPAPTGLTYINQGTAYQFQWSPVTAAEYYNVYVDGVLVGTSSGITKAVLMTDEGRHTVEVAAVLYGIEGQRAQITVGGPPVDPGNGGGFDPNCETCVKLKELLQCPEWDNYMGDFTNAIKNALPPPPNWQEVANVMKNTIVPAIGQELLDKMPQYSKIIADEFQSREKAVSSPPALPSFNPTVPKMTDLPQKINDSITDNVPSFEPSFTESKPFTIPDPLQIDMSTNDKGYVRKPLDTTSPSYKKNEKAAEPNQAYKPMPEPGLSGSPAYKNKSPSNGGPMPSYKNTSPAQSEPMKNYHITNNAPMPTYTNTNETSRTPMPEYNPRMP